MRPSNQSAAPFFVAIFAILILSASVSDAAITCGTVLSSLRPCIGYLQGAGPTPPGPCCGGVKSLAAAASSKPDKQAACVCLKSAAPKLKVDASRAKSLPQSCGVSLSVPISPSVDCNTIS